MIGAIVCVERLERGGEDLLEDVLGVLSGAEHVAAEGKEPGLVALHERLEGALMTSPDECDQPLVGLQPEQGRTACKGRESRRVLKCCCLQGQSEGGGYPP